MSTISTTLTETKRTWTEVDQRLMSRALKLAREGVGLVSPGPLVGCVITDASGEVVGEGFYVFEEISHAETNALNQAGTRADGGTAYVSLEPHAHHGRTPPCTDALITAGIKRVVAPIEDLNPKVSGKGFEHLRRAGIQVEVGLMANEAAELNEAYLHYMRTGRPFVHLKMAVSLDGKIATRTGDSRWVAGPECRELVQELRHQYDAILVGSGTAAIDNPLLTDRSGLQRRRQLVRIVLAKGGNLSVSSQLASSAKESPVVVVVGPEADSEQLHKLESCGVEIIRNESGDLTTMLSELGKRDLQSILVEGGSEVAGAFVDSSLVNKVTFFIAPKIVGGSDAPTAIAGLGVEHMRDALSLQGVQISRLGDDFEVTGYLSSVRE